MVNNSFADVLVWGSGCLFFLALLSSIVRFEAMESANVSVLFLTKLSWENRTKKEQNDPTVYEGGL